MNCSIMPGIAFIIALAKNIVKVKLFAVMLKSR
jgi:hypothetical protein